MAEANTVHMKEDGEREENDDDLCCVCLVVTGQLLCRNIPGALCFLVN